MPVTMRPTGGLPLWLLARLKFLAATAGGPHFGARSGRPGAMDLIKVEKVVADFAVAGGWR
jgi:hypothetical protein